MTSNVGVSAPNVSSHTSEPISSNKGKSTLVVGRYGNENLCTKALVSTCTSTWVRLSGPNNPFIKESKLDNSGIRGRHDPLSSTKMTLT